MTIATDYRAEVFGWNEDLNRYEPTPEDMTEDEYYDNEFAIAQERKDLLADFEW